MKRQSLAELLISGLRRIKVGNHPNLLFFIFDNRF